MRGSNELIVSAVLLLLLCILPAGNGFAEERRLSLGQAVQEALLNNLNLQLNKEILQESMGVTQASEGTFDTLLSATAGTGNTQTTPIIPGAADDESSSNWSVALQKTFTPGTEVELSWENNQVDSNADGLLIDPVYNSGVNLKVSQPLMRGFGTEIQTAGIHAAQKREDATAMQVESVSADLAAEVINSYWDLVFSWQDIEVQKISLQLAEKLLEDTRNRIEAGKLAEVELFRPQSEVARREEALISAERTIGLADDRLKILLNNDDWDTIIHPTDLPSTETHSFDPQVILDNSLKNRPDLKAAKLNEEAAEIVRRNAKDRTRSALNLFGSVGVGGTDDNYGSSLDNISGETDSSWQIGLAFSRPLSNSFAKGELVQAEASLRQAKTTTDILEQDIRRAVRSAMRDVRLAIKNMEATRKTSLASLKGLEAEQVKFDAGRATTLDVLVAQQSYSASLSQEKLAVISYAKTLAELDRIQGIVRIPKI